jgi:hypothetical protein
VVNDIHVIANRRRRQLRRHLLNQFLYGLIVDAGQESAFEEGINPLVQGVAELEILSSTFYKNAVFGWKL